MKQDKFPEAELVLTETMQKFPHDEFCRTILAQVLMKQDKFPEAELVLTEAMQKFPQNEVCHTILAQVLMKQDKFPEAELRLNRDYAKIPPERILPQYPDPGPDGPGKVSRGGASRKKGYGKISPKTKSTPTSSIKLSLRKKLPYLQRIPCILLITPNLFLALWLKNLLLLKRMSFTKSAMSGKPSTNLRNLSLWKVRMAMS